MSKATPKTTVYYRIEQVPVSVDKAFRAVCDAGGLGHGAAFSAILQVVPIKASIMAGAQVLDGQAKPEKTVTLGVHIPPADKQAIKDNLPSGTKQGVAGALILLSQKSQLGAKVGEGIVAKVANVRT